MKRLIVASLLLMGGLCGMTLNADPGILANFGPVKVFIPLTEVSVVYNYDFVGKRNLVGGETPLFRVWNLDFTGGAVTSIDGAGSPFVGINLALPNPLSDVTTQSWNKFIQDVHPGLFGGRDFKENAWILGIKASVSIFQ